MRILALLAFSTTALSFAQQPPLVIPHFADGGGWKSTIAVFNNGVNVTPVHLTIKFRGDDGALVPVDLNNYGSLSTLDTDLGVQSALYLDTAGTRPAVQVGWVEVDQTTGSGAVEGFVIFRNIALGRPDFEAVSNGMRAASSMTFPFDNTNGVVTTFAIANLSVSTCTVAAFPIFDESGIAVVGQPQLIGNMYGFGHMGFIATDRIPEMGNKRGHLTFNPLIGCGSGGIAMLGLRFNPSGAFTNLEPLSVTTP
jgi:hypothetical protein